MLPMLRMAYVRARQEKSVTIVNPLNLNNDGVSVSEKVELNSSETKAP